ncbi:MAG TPA: hypothetical protein VMT35_11325, partial [Ignavibacteriaceae bacterium]|nr:hypothetical protein [Ignavibacteriaceae bacterium]
MVHVTLLLLFLCWSSPGITQEKLTSMESWKREGRSIILSTDSGQEMKLTPYGDYIVRIQPIRKGENYFPDDYYEMIESKIWEGKFKVKETKEFLLIETIPSDGILVKIKKNPVRIEFCRKNDKSILLSEKDGIVWENKNVYASFILDNRENFTGLGHTYLGRSTKINLKGELIERNYGAEHGEQAPLIVPFYLSSKGYGIFLNSTFPNFFNFGKDKKYEFGFNDEGFKSRMDYFFILGPEFPEILDRYTQLTGRPRLPMKAVFGLALSDKGNPLDSKD